MRKKIILLLCVLFALLTCVSGCGSIFSGLFVDYGDERIIEIKDSEDVIIVQPYEALMGSGATVYYKRPYGRKIKLGGVSCDDGVKFQYACNVHDGYVTISYKSGGSNWSQRSFDFPEEKWYHKIFG